jgi:hypothetical protein
MWNPGQVSRLQARLVLALVLFELMTWLLAWFQLARRLYSTPVQ